MFRLYFCGWLILFASVLSFSESVHAQEPVPVQDNPVPDYPEKARFALITGDVWFRAYVTEEGAVQNFEITRVPARDMGFEDAVAPVIRKWRFEPARVGSLPIAAWFEGNVRFSLRQDDEEQIQSLTERAALGWNREDAQVLAGLFSEIAHIHTVTQEPARGPYRIRERFAELLSTTLSGADLTLSVDMMRFYDEDRAEAEHTYQLTGSIEHVGRIATTLTRTEEQWFIDHARLIEGAGMLWDTDPVVEFRPPEPPIPLAARENNVTGRVLLEVLIGLDGSTEVVEVLEGLPHGCTEAGIDHARQWRWKPALREGKPVESTGTIWVSFGEGEP